MPAVMLGFGGWHSIFIRAAVSPSLPSPPLGALWCGAMHVQQLASRSFVVFFWWLLAISRSGTCGVVAVHQGTCRSPLLLPCIFIGSLQRLQWFGEAAAGSARLVFACCFSGGSLDIREASA